MISIVTFRTAVLFGFVGAAGAFAACSSSDSPATPSGDGGSAESSTDSSLPDTSTADSPGLPDQTDPLNCVPPGTKGNEKGLGGYCEPKIDNKGGGQCDMAGPAPDHAPRICSADVEGTPVHAWFCTLPCAGDEECGTNEYCVHDARGMGCVPLSCKSLEDGGLEAGDAADGADGS